MSCYFKTTPKDQKQHALSGRAASRSLGLSPFLSHMQKLNLSLQQNLDGMSQTIL